MIHTIKAQKSKELIPTLFLFLFDMINIHLKTLALYISSLQSHTLLLGKIPTILKPASAHKLLISSIV